MPADLAPVDESVRLPESVRRAAAEAEQLHKAVYQTPDTVTPADQATGDQPVGDGDKPITIVDTTPAPLQRVSTPAGDKVILPKPAQAAPPPAQASAQPAPATVATQPAQAPQEPPKLILTPRGQQSAEPQAPPGDDPAARIAYFEQVARSANGRYEQSQRMIGTLQEQLVQMGDEVSRLTQILTRQNQPASQSAEPAVPAAAFTPQEREQYGDEALSVMARAARAAVGQDLQALTSQNKQLLEQMQQDRQRATMRTNHAALDQAIPNWREINRSQEFAQWLSLPDYYSGALRGEMLKQAFAAGDASRVVRFFQGFVTEAMSQAGIPAIVPAQTAQTRPALSLSSLAAPGPAKPAAGSDATPAERPIYTHQEIAGFYSEVRRGLWANRPDQKAAIEADIIAAGREGRVR